MAYPNEIIVALLVVIALMLYFLIMQLGENFPAPAKLLGILEEIRDDVQYFRMREDPTRDDDLADCWPECRPPKVK